MCTFCTHPKGQPAADLRKHCARGGTRTGFQALQTLDNPGNIPKPKQSGSSTTRSDTQGVHIVHTFFLASPTAARSAEMSAAPPPTAPPRRQ